MVPKPPRILEPPAPGSWSAWGKWGWGLGGKPFPPGTASQPRGEVPATSGMDREVESSRCQGELAEPRASRDIHMAPSMETTAPGTPALPRAQGARQLHLQVQLCLGLAAEPRPVLPPPWASVPPSAIGVLWLFCPKAHSQGSQPHGPRILGSNPGQRTSPFWASISPYGEMSRSYLEC